MQASKAVFVWQGTCIRYACNPCAAYARHLVNVVFIKNDQRIQDAGKVVHLLLDVSSEWWHTQVQREPGCECVVGVVRFVHPRAFKKKRWTSRNCNSPLLLLLTSSRFRSSRMGQERPHAHQTRVPFD